MHMKLTLLKISFKSITRQTLEEEYCGSMRGMIVILQHVIAENCLKPVTKGNKAIKNYLLMAAILCSTVFAGGRLVLR